MIQFYRNKLVELGVMKNLKNSCQTLQQKRIKKKIIVA